MNRRLVILQLAMIVLSVATGCTGLSNSFRDDVVFIQDACGFDFDQRIELERLSFKLPSFWSRLSPCQAMQISRNTHRDDWGVNARMIYGEGKVIVLDKAAGFGISSNIHLIGKELVRPDEWLIERQEYWQMDLHDENSRPKERNLTRIRYGQLDCWRIETMSYMEKIDQDGHFRGQYQQSYLSIGYECWDMRDEEYPSIGFSAGVAYQGGKPLYDIDIDQVLVKPVLESIELKDLSSAAYEKRLAETRQRERERCNRLVKGAWESGTRNIDDHYKRLIRECGYDPNTLERIDQ
ncbi:MAG: hypothetical protein HUJ28_08160 [Chromatiales bacterium]|nr:hypothetical protein [Chromatiales bacterium]